MKRKIAILRIAGILSFLAFIILSIMRMNTGLTDQKNARVFAAGEFSLLQITLSALAVSCFLAIMIIQAYRFYINRYLEKEEE